MSEELATPLDELRTEAGDADAPPPVLLPYQQDWIADEAQVKVCEKGRRTGLTWAEAADDVLIAAADGGSKVFYISATEDMAREYIEACAMWTRAFNYAASAIGEGMYDDGEDDEGKRRLIKTFEIDYPRSRNRIVALSSRPKNLRGKQGVIVIDEAAFHDDMDGMIKAAMAMTIWGDKIRIISTHNGVESAFNALIQDIRAGKLGGADVASVHRVPFMGAVRQGLFHRVCLRKGKQWTQQGEDEFVQRTYAIYRDHSAEELDAVPSQSTGAYLSLALIEQRMVTAWPADPDGPVVVRAKWDDGFAYLPEDVRRAAIDAWIAEELQPHLARLSPLRRHVFAQDFGRNVDQSVMVLAEEDGDLTHRPRITIELGNCPFSAQEHIAVHVIRALPRFRGGAVDSTGNGAAQGEKLAQVFGVEMIEQVKLNDPFYLAHMPKLKAGLQDGTLRDLARDEAHRDDLRAIKQVNGVPKVPRDERRSAGQAAAAAEAGSRQQRHGDFAIALFLAEYAFHREAGEIAWTAAPDSERRWDEADAAGGGRMRMRPGSHPEDFAGLAADGRKAGW